MKAQAKLLMTFTILAIAIAAIAAAQLNDSNATGMAVSEIEPTMNTTIAGVSMVDSASADIVSQAEGANTSANETDDTAALAKTETALRRTETAQTEEPQTATTEEGMPLLVVDVVYPQKLVRGELADIKATIRNDGGGTAAKISIEWVLPAGFELVSEANGCAELKPAESCTAAARVKAGTELGKVKAKIVLQYE